jgi:hypothetical protein
VASEGHVQMTVSFLMKVGLQLWESGFFLPLGTARYTAVTAVTAGVR